MSSRNPLAARASLIAVLMILSLSSCATSDSVRPGINDAYALNASAEFWEGRFQVESREIWSERERIVDAIGLFRGAAVADVGAGTGFLSRMMAERVGLLGRVYAVDLMPYFVEHMRERARAEGIRNLTAVQCTDRSVELPPHSIDIAFICDAYHHFEYPADTMASIWRALRPGGKLVVIDFHRIPGVTRPWVVDHVRAGEEVFASEIEAAGFQPEGRLDILKENYFRWWRKRL